LSGAKSYDFGTIVCIMPLCTKAKSKKTHTSLRKLSQSTMVRLDARTSRITNHWGGAPLRIATAYVPKWNKRFSARITHAGLFGRSDEKRCSRWRSRAHSFDRWDSSGQASSFSNGRLFHTGILVGWIMQRGKYSSLKW